MRSSPHPDDDFSAQAIGVTADVRPPSRPHDDRGIGTEHTSMTRTAAESRREVHAVVVGGGVAGLEATLALRALGPDLVDVELVAPEHHFFYRPLAVAEPFGRARLYRWELADLLRAAGAEFTPGTLRAVDADRRVIHLEHGARIEYDAVLLACGARSEVALPNALTFRGPADTERFSRLLDRAKGGRVERLVFAVPPGVSWPLPLYELALLTAAELERASVDAELTFVTPEPAPLAVLGTKASQAVHSLLSEHRIVTRTAEYPAAVTENGLSSVPGGDIDADGVVSLPRLKGPAIEGISRDRDGFVPTDAHGRVRGAADVYAAGDVTTFPIKQGGLAAQQADAAAETIAATAGASVEPRPFEPVLRALLLTGREPAFLCVELGGGHGESTRVSDEPLWWPAGKIVGRHLAPFLADLGVLDIRGELTEEDVLRIEVDASAAHELAWRG
jgi:sulfide:quinone oxidoreductase